MESISDDNNENKALSADISDISQIGRSLDFEEDKYYNKSLEKYYKGKQLTVNCKR